MTAEWVKVTDLLRNLKSSIDNFNLREDSQWFRMMTEKTADDQFPTLIRAIQSEGFTDPIGVKIGRNIPIRNWDDYGIESNDDWLMGNGHHRLCAAILLGMEEILVDFGTTWPRIDRYYDVQERITDDDRSDCLWISDTVSDSALGEDKELVNA